MAGNIENTTSYKIGYKLGDIFFKFISGIFKLIWKGVKVSVKNKVLLIIFASLLLSSFLSYLIFHNGYMLLTLPLLLLVMGIWQYIKEAPIRKRKSYFEALFYKVGLIQDNRLPQFLEEQALSEFASVYTFHTLISLDTWISKKEDIEILMNQKIINIVQDKNNYQIVHLILEDEALPNQINWDDSFIDENRNILNIGMDYYGVVGMELEKYPHAFIAGETGSGKSNILKCLIHQALLKGYEVVLIDFKRGVSFSSFSDYVTVYYEYKDVMRVLKEMVKETSDRLDKFRMAKVDNLSDYNRRYVDLPRKIIFIDELAELLRVRDKEISTVLNDSIETLTRLSRAVGIHLIMGIQRPDSTIVNGQIKNNVSYRVCGRFVDREPSRIMLGDDIASTLPNIKGRFIVKDDDYHEIQSFYFMGVSSGVVQ